jgi:hypothetical protein
LLIGIRPKDYKELFNLRHAQARNVIERIFGVLKKRFAALSKPMEYSVEDQAKIMQALCVIHNFIRIHDPDDIPKINKVDINPEPMHVSGMDNLRGSVSRAEREKASRKRDEIAKAMWDSYQDTVQRRRTQD